MEIVIIDYGMGNLSSIQNMLQYIGARSTITNDPAVIKNAEKIILSGVGAFDKGISNLTDLGLLPVLNEKIKINKAPVLGICLGMQLFTKKSEEGKLAGLGWINAETKRFNFSNKPAKLKVPHMGWNTVSPTANSKLFKNALPEIRFYFVHSYHLICEDKADIASYTYYEYKFVSAVERDNIFGVQFHPEKSHKFGMALLKNFVQLS